MNELKSVNMKAFLLGILIIIIGFIMAIKPDFCQKITVIALGVGAIALGAYNLIVVLKKIEDELYKKTFIIKSCVSIGIGLIAVVLPWFFVEAGNTIWFVINVILAIYLILYAVVNFYSAAKIGSSDDETKKRLTAEGLICLLVSVLLFIIGKENPMTIVFRVTGIASIIAGFVILFIELFMRKDIAVKDDDIVIKDAVVKDADEDSKDN